MDSTIELQQNALEKVEIKCDDNEQCSRRPCLRIHDTELNYNEDNDCVINKMEKYYVDMGLEFNESETDRAHYIGKPTVDKNTKKKCKSTIVKFKSWKSRTTFYKARPKSYDEKKKNPGVKFSISLDLTKRCYDLLKTVRDLTKNNAISHVFFCDANCSLALNFNDNTYKYFDSENELKRLPDV